MLAVGKNLVKNASTEAPESPPPDRSATLLKIALPVVGAVALANIFLAYRDVRRLQTRAASLERQVQDTRTRNQRIESITETLPRDPATLDRWLRERDRLLPEEEVVLPESDSRRP